MDNPVFDATIVEIILEMRRRAHVLNAWMNPRVSREAVILNAAADALEALNGCDKSLVNDTKCQGFVSEFDRLMK